MLKKMLNIQLINHVHRAREVGLQKVLNLSNVIIVQVEEKLELIKVFSRFSKHVLSVVGMVKESINPVITVVETARFKLMKM